jgi:hypothetical protein
MFTECCQGQIDSLKLAARFMASAIVCRAILVFELAGMKDTLLKEPEDKVDDIRPQHQF